jgi:hypothetical protein
VANIVFNIAKGRVVELYNRVENNDPANSAIILVPIETSGLEADATLIDVDSLAALIAGATNEQTTMGRKTLTDTELAALPAPDDTNDRYEVSLPAVTWTAASGNAISKLRQRHDRRHRFEHHPAVHVRFRADPVGRGYHDAGRHVLPRELRS